LTKEFEARELSWIAERSAMKSKTENDSGSQGSDDRKFPYELKLYVISSSARCAKALQNVKHVCDEHLEHRYRLQVIDLGRISAADAVKRGPISAPTLVRLLSGSEKMLIGDLTPERILWFLDLPAR
jgi:circadian clock protein KaiB